MAQSKADFFAVILRELKPNRYRKYRTESEILILKSYHNLLIYNHFSLCSAIKNSN